MTFLGALSIVPLAVQHWPPLSQLDASGPAYFFVLLILAAVVDRPAALAWWWLLAHSLLVGGVWWTLGSVYDFHDRLWTVHVLEWIDLPVFSALDLLDASPRFATSYVVRTSLIGGGGLYAIAGWWMASGSRERLVSPPRPTIRALLALMGLAAALWVAIQRSESEQGAAPAIFFWGLLYLAYARWRPLSTAAFVLLWHTILAGGVLGLLAARRETAQQVWLIPLYCADPHLVPLFSRLEAWNDERWRIAIAATSLVGGGLVYALGGLVLGAIVARRGHRARSQAIPTKAPLATFRRTIGRRLAFAALVAAATTTGVVVLRSGSTHSEVLAALADFDPEPPAIKGRLILGDLAGAQKSLMEYERRTDPPVHISRLRLATMQAYDGDLVSARRTAAAIESHHWRLLARWKVEVVSDDGDPRAAQATLDQLLTKIGSVAPPLRRMHMYGDVASMAADLDDMASAEAALGLAHQSAQDVGFPSLHFRALLDLEYARWKTDDRETTIAAIEAVRAAAQQELSLADYARFRNDVAELQSAVAVSQRELHVRSIFERHEPVRIVNSFLGQPMLGDPPGERDYGPVPIDKIYGGFESAIRLAEEHRMAGRWDDALAATQRILRTTDQAMAYLEIALALAENGSCDRALEITTALPSLLSRADWERSRLTRFQSEDPEMWLDLIPTFEPRTPDWANGIKLTVLALRLHTTLFGENPAIFAKVLDEYSPDNLALVVAEQAAAGESDATWRWLKRLRPSRQIVRGSVWSSMNLAPSGFFASAQSVDEDTFSTATIELAIDLPTPDERRRVILDYPPNWGLWQ